MFCERARLEVVDADDAVTALEQVVAEVRAEEAGAAGDDRGRHSAGCYPHPLPVVADFTRALHRFRSCPQRCEEDSQRWRRPLSRSANRGSSSPGSHGCHTGTGEDVDTRLFRRLVEVLEQFLPLSIGSDGAG